MTQYILDTNVIVSALVGRNPQSPPAVILRLALAGRLPLVASILWKKEVEDVLARPSLLKATRRSQEDIEIFLNTLFGNVRLIAAATKREAPDSGDNFLWTILEDVPDSVLITGDRLLVESTDFPGRILTPAMFLTRYPSH